MILSKKALAKKGIRMSINGQGSFVTLEAEAKIDTAPIVDFIHEVINDDALADHLTEEIISRIQIIQLVQVVGDTQAEAHSEYHNPLKS